jgi:geranylgeranyl pyrophosphate synthase
MAHSDIKSELLILFEAALENYIDENYSPINSLMESISYSLGGQGKRVRPMMALLTTHAFGQKEHVAIPAAIAIEMIHAYSLTHDDLPCMDNDELRRGKPTTHIKFGQDTALLAGDALLTDAFEAISNAHLSGLSDSIKLSQIKELTLAAGSKGMVLGQSLDLYWTNRAGASEDDIDDIHLNKTGALMGAACAMGAVAAGAGIETISIFRNFGRTVGLAFQIQDDLLDDQDGTGKSIGKDREANKLTYLRFMNREEAHLNSQKLIEAAIQSVEILDLNTDALIEFTSTLTERKI